MEKPYLNPTFWKWVDQHINDDVARLLFSYKGKVDFLREAALQIDCRKQFGKKLHKTLEEFPHFYFPTKLSGEQATGDALAEFHSTLVNESDTLVDLTAGLGIDVMHLSKHVKKSLAIERNEELTDALKYNSRGLGITNIEVITGDCREIVSSQKGTVAFIDPARRSTEGGRIFALKDSEPDITAMLPTLRENFERVIVKASPMLDITQITNEVPNISDIFVLGTSTECKELLFVIDFKNNKENIEIHAVTILNDGEINDFSFTRTEELSATPIVSNKRPVSGDYLYVPYPAVIKALPVNILSARYNLKKFHNNTHLYFSTSENKQLDFPGEALEIVEVVPWQSKNIKRFKTTYPNVSVSARNFGMSAEALRAKLGVKEGGSLGLRVFGIGLGKDESDRILIVTRPLK